LYQITDSLRLYNEYIGLTFEYAHMHTYTHISYSLIGSSYGVHVLLERAEFIQVCHKTLVNMTR